MSLEDLTGTNKFITNLVPANPGSGDDKREGDDHIRGTKNVLVNTFPALNAQVTATPAQLNSTAQGPFLPLAGVTPMTGPLNGTTANFSGAVTLGDALADTITIGGGSSKNATGNWTFAAPSSGITLKASVVDSGSVTISSSSGAHTGFLYFGDNGSDTSGWLKYDHSNDSLQLGTVNTERFRISSTGNVTIAAPSSGPTLAVVPDPTFPAVEVGFRGMPEIAPAGGQDINRTARGKMTYVTSGRLYFNTAIDAYQKDDVYPVWNNTAANMILGTFGVTFIVNGAFTTADQTVLPYRLVTVIFVTATTALVVGIE